MAREGALLHAGEDEIHDETRELKADTPRRKWDNFWFYHKWHVVVGVALILLLSAFVHDIFFRVRPDYKIALVTQAAYPSDTEQQLKETIEKYGKDLNGDGRVQVEIMDYVYPPENDPDPNMAQMRAGSTVKIQADVGNGDSMLYITDEPSFRELRGAISMFGTPDGQRLENGTMEQTRVGLRQCAALASLDGSSEMGVEGTDLLSRLGISLRLEKNQDGSEVKSGSAYYQANRELLQKLMEG